jgi:hypothetical protein
MPRVTLVLPILGSTSVGVDTQNLTEPKKQHKRDPTGRRAYQGVSQQTVDTTV